MIKKKLTKKKKVIIMAKEKEKEVEFKEEDKYEGLNETQIAHLKKMEEAEE